MVIIFFEEISADDSDGFVTDGWGGGQFKYFCILMCIIHHIVLVLQGKYDDQTPIYYNLLEFFPTV